MTTCQCRRNGKDKEYLERHRASAVLPPVQKGLSALEERKNHVELAILQEEIKKPFLTKKQIAYAFEKFKKPDISTRESKQKLIDYFINAIYLYDDKVISFLTIKMERKRLALTSFCVRIIIASVYQ